MLTVIQIHSDDHNYIFRFFFFSSCIFPSSSSSEAPSVDTTAPVVGVPSESTGQASTGIVPPDAPQLFFQQTNGIHVSKRCLGSVQATVPSSMYDFNDDPTSERYEMIITTVITMCNMGRAILYSWRWLGRTTRMNLNDSQLFPS